MLENIKKEMALCKPQTRNLVMENEANLQNNNFAPLDGTHKK